MTDEIKALREEVAKLRERIAVLEAARGTYTHMPALQWSPNGPLWVQPQTGTPYVLPTITCTSDGNQK